MKALLPIILGLIFVLAAATPTLGSSQPTRDSAVLDQKFPTESNPSKVRTLESLGRSDSAASDSLFDEAVADESFEVRRAIVVQFLKTRSHLSVEQQAERFRKLFVLKPYQARLDAMLGYLSLRGSDRAKLATVVDARFKSTCKSESRAEVKEACEKIISSQPSAVATKEAK